MKYFFLFFLELFSFGSARAIVINLLLILLVLLVIPTSFVENEVGVPCVFHFLLESYYSGNCPDSGFLKNCECPSCGMTRALSNLMHGDFAKAHGFNRGSFLVLLVMLGLIGWNGWKWWGNTK